MKTQLIGTKISPREFREDLIQKRLISKLKKYLTNFETHIQNAALTIRQGSRWGYNLRFNMSLPKNEKVFAEASGKTIEDALVPLRDKITKQLQKYRSKLSINHQSRNFLHPTAS